MNKFLVILTILISANTFAGSKRAVTKTVKKAAATKAAPAAETTTRSESVSAPEHVNPQPSSKKETPSTASTSSAAVTGAKQADVITGTVDLRPSWGSNQGEVHTENWVDIGYKTGNLHLMYEQDFNTNIYSPGASTTGMNLQLQFGLFRAKVADVWVSPTKTYSLAYELRPYIPTFAPERDKGMITIVRNYAKFAAKVSDAVTLSLWEVPIVHFYDRAGSNLAGVVSANKAFENRVYLMADWNITDKWSVSIPFWLSSSKYREFAGATTSGTWDQSLWTYPELDYAVNSNYTLGLSWYNNSSFYNSTTSDWTISDGFKGGITQVVFRATL